MKKFVSVPPGAVRLNDPVLAPRLATARQVTIPDCLRKIRETGQLDAFQLDYREGEPNRPHIFWDSDVAKVLEGVALLLATGPDAALMAELDRCVDLVISAQQPDGYLNIVFSTYRQGERWTDLTYCHELYCAGHLIEAATAHFRLTGKRKFLDAMCRYADCIGAAFGRGPGQRRGYPGHEEIELALYKLADATGEARYRELAKYFITERGRAPNYFRQEHPALSEDDLRYFQAHRPVAEQHDADGHAVRALYLYCGMADLAAAEEDDAMLRHCEALFERLVRRRMYITGGVGSTSRGERFTVDYDLPNDTAYAESCAAIALVFFAQRLLNLTGDGRYADILERALYNGVLSGLGLDGESYFYANLLEVGDHTFEHGHVNKTRQPWFTCSCCPTNFCRFLPQLGSLLFSTADDEIRLHIPAAGEVEADLESGKVKLTVRGDYPYGEEAAVLVQTPGRYRIAVRRPGWCDGFSLELNGEAVPAAGEERQYLILERDWRSGDILTLKLPMPIMKQYAHPKVAADAGRAAIMRGPLIYALESVDNGADLAQLILAPDPAFTLTEAAGLPAGTPAIRGRARRELPGDGETLYSGRKPAYEAAEFTAIPYALWQNRGPAAMLVWIRNREA